MSSVEPTFLFIGPDKTGSSWMYELLRLHPECFVPVIKDIYFFDRYYDRGLPWYLGFFRDAGPQHKAVGELSHDYLFSEEAARRIRKHFPQVRLLTCLRDPVDRSFSQYLYFIRSGMTQSPFRQAVERFPEIVENSRYFKYLSRYYELFSPEQMGVLFFDQLREEPVVFSQQLCSFLGISQDCELPPPERVASAPRSAVLARSMKWGANAARNLGMPKVVGVLKRSWIQQLLYRKYGKVDRPQLDPADRVWLREQLRPDYLKLRELLPGVPKWKGVAD